MIAIENFLNYLSENWLTLLVCIGLTFTLVKMITRYLSLDTNERIGIAKKQIKEAMLKLITEAEIDFEEWNKSGKIKRSQVITKIYEKYPIISKAISQDDIIAWIDKEIDNSLVTLREIIKENKIDKKEE
jgi:predicted GTPase